MVVFSILMRPILDISSELQSIVRSKYDLIGPGFVQRADPCPGLEARVRHLSQCRRQIAAAILVFRVIREHAIMFDLMKI
jgi:hypothetical protein